MDNDNGRRHILTVDELADRTRFKFHQRTLEIPELGGSIKLKSLTVREREELPDPAELLEIDDKGLRTEASIRNSAEVFARICVDPKLTTEQATEALAMWPAEALDRVTTAYAEMVGNESEVKAAGAEFQGEQRSEVPVSPGS